MVAAAGDFASSEKHYPAALDGVIGVGALNGAGKLTALSNTGSWVSTNVNGFRQRTTTDRNERLLVSGTSAAMATVGARLALFRATERQKKVSDLLQAAKGDFFSQPSTFTCNPKPVDNAVATPDTPRSFTPTITPSAANPATFTPGAPISNSTATPSPGGSKEGSVTDGGSASDGNSSSASPGEVGSTPPQITSIAQGREWLGKDPPVPGSQTNERVLIRKVTANNSRNIEEIFRNAGERNAGERNAEGKLIDPNVTEYENVVRLQILQNRPPGSCRSLVLKYRNNRPEDANDVNCPRYKSPVFPYYGCKTVTETFIGQQDIPGFPGSFGIRHVCDSPGDFNDPRALVTLKGSYLQVIDAWYHKNSNHPSRIVASFERSCSDSSSPRGQVSEDRRDCLTNKIIGEETVTVYTNTEPSLANIPKNYIPDLVGDFKFEGDLKSPGTYTGTTKCFTYNLNGPIAFVVVESLWFLYDNKRFFNDNGKKRDRPWKEAASRASPPVALKPLPPQQAGGVTFSIFNYYNLNYYFQKNIEDIILEVVPLGDRFLRVRLTKGVYLVGGDYIVGYFPMGVSMPGYAYCYLEDFP